jgi:hypothetical protein
VIETRRRPPRRRHPLRRALVAIGLLVAFGVGIALGQALEEGPRAGQTITRERTLRPLPLPPVRETVTVTSTRD